MILSLNIGSSTVKFGLFRNGSDPPREADAVQRGTIPSGGVPARRVFDEIRSQLGEFEIDAVGHRIVFGGERHIVPECVTPALLADLEGFIPLMPLHLPREIAFVREASTGFRDVPQVACFDTAFHADMPTIAKRIPIPRALWQEGVQRYGFHGLSYEFIVYKLGADVAGRTIIAHLGNGASLAALRDGKPIDTTMGLSALGGLMMGTRPGDLDPGVILYLMGRGFDVDRVRTLFDEQSGLLGVSETTSDVEKLLAIRASDERAAEALDLFVYTARKYVGSLGAVLGGIDRLIFTGGIGEHAAPIRDAIADGLVSSGATHVIATDENLMIARHTHRVLRST